MDLETEQKLQYFDPKLMAVNVVSFSFFWCSTGGPRVHSAGCWFSLLHLISIFSGPQFIRAPSPFGLVWLSLPYLVSVSNATGTPIRTQLTYIIVHRPLDRPLDLWNRMFNRHQAEITVMQFTGHSLPVRQSMRVSWDFLACPILLANFRPRDFLSKLPLKCVTSFQCITLNSILGRVEGQNITYCLHLCCYFHNVSADISSGLLSYRPKRCVTVQHVSQDTTGLFSWTFCVSECLCPFMHMRDGVCLNIYPHPPRAEWIQSFSSLCLVVLPKLNSRERIGKQWVHALPKDICTKRNAKSLAQGLNSVRWFDFPGCEPLR